MADEKPDWSSIAMTPRARQHYQNKFLPRYRRYLSQVRNTPLTLLVWGPGPAGGELYEKRLQIRGELRKRGFAALFSEEIETDFPVPELSFKAKEILQACSADLIVILMASHGSSAEVHDFAGFIRDIGRKMMIFISSDFQQGYSYGGALRELNAECGNVHIFEFPKDIHECHLLTAVIERAETLRHAEWRRTNLK